jgi:metal iron transporter
MRRIITRFLAIIPSMAIAIGLGMPGINSLLVASQVVLSIVLPFVIFPLLYCTSNKAIMSVRKTRTGMILDDSTTSKVTLTAVDVSPEELQQPRDRDSSIAEIARGREAIEDDDDSEMVDYGNNKLVIAIGVFSWLLIVAANVYVIVELGLGSQT